MNHGKHWLGIVLPVTGDLATTDCVEKEEEEEEEKDFLLSPPPAPTFPTDRLFSFPPTL